MQHFLFGICASQTADISDNMPAVHALELQIVYSEHCPYLFKQRVIPVELFQIHRDKRRMPVVAVDDIRQVILRNVLHSLEHGF